MIVNRYLNERPIQKSELKAIRLPEEILCPAVEAARKRIPFIEAQEMTDISTSADMAYMTSTDIPQNG